MIKKELEVEMNNILKDIDLALSGDIFNHKSWNWVMSFRDKIQEQIDRMRDCE